MFTDTAHVDPPALASAPDHRDLRSDDFWRAIPAYAHVSADEFRTHTFQNRHTVTNSRQLRETLADLVPTSFYEDLEAGVKNAPMALRISPYLLALIDWRAPETDPIRTQFLPLRTQQQPDHPMLRYDSLNEREDSPVPGLTHRYRDKALFLPQDSCPVYCRFCTRSYAVGSDTDAVEKMKLTANLARWEQAFAYIASQPDLEDIVISGGDSYNLSAAHLQFIGERLLQMPNIRRLRYATKGLCVQPQKILSDHAWTDALTRVVELGRRMHKDVVVHTHFNHPNEITTITRDAMNLLTERGIHVRSQGVLQRTVNDDAATMTQLVRRLSYVNIHAYYIYVHDMVPGVEDLRTSLATAQHLEKHVRGSTAGFNTPAFVLDTPGGGGKRDVHSAERYDRASGISVFESPSVKPGKQFLYFDPIAALDPEHQWRWTQPTERRAMIDAALAG
ncbi:MAG: KamA family radical SAM protein [Verrucomicrobia bacterium]|nr:MAG: KamA family radical SAM protein [Verrucomicrobiota bacterium]